MQRLRSTRRAPPSAEIVYGEGRARSGPCLARGIPLASPEPTLSPVHTPPHPTPPSCAMRMTSTHTRTVTRTLALLLVQHQHSHIGLSLALATAAPHHHPPRPQRAGQAVPRATRARRRLRSPTAATMPPRRGVQDLATRLIGGCTKRARHSRRIALPPSLVGSGAAACVLAVSCVAAPFVGVPLLLACSPRREE